MRYTNDGNYTAEELDEAIRITKKEHPGWDLEDFSVKSDEKGAYIDAPASHHTKQKMRAIQATAGCIREKAEGIETYTVSVALDCRVDVQIKAKSLEKAKRLVVNGNFDYDIENAEVVGAHPVNISGPDGELLEDF